MNAFKTVLIVLGFSISFTTYAQDDKTSYYEQRAQEDAQFEQEYKAEKDTEEAGFWEGQKDYEKELKRRDRKAYRAYIKGKRDAYAAHYQDCDGHHYHSDHYYHHASFYYREYYYKRYPRRNTINAGVRLSTPRVKIGIF